MEHYFSCFNISHHIINCPFSFSATKAGVIVVLSFVLQWFSIQCNLVIALHDFVL